MDARDKLSLTQPPASVTTSNVKTPSPDPSSTPFRNLATGLTVSPASRTLPTPTMQHQPQSVNTDDATDKSALSFILSSSDSESDDEKPTEVKSDDAVKRKRRLNSTTPTASTSEAAGGTTVRKGSKFCSVEGCTSRAKHAKRCWKHGGWVRCKVQDCNNRAKSKGVCWSHGGGTVCSFENCDTISVSNGFCWAHGGGKRCQVANCSKPAYERTQNYCQTHFEEHQAAGAMN